VRAWLDSPVERQTGTRDELPLKLALAATLPGVDVGAIVQRQRRASLSALQELRRAQYAGEQTDAGGDGLDGGPDGEELAWRLVADALIFQAEAEVRWLDHVEGRLTRHPARALELELATERPRRGRPPKAEADAAASGSSAAAAGSR
jgi:hypothetical protein